MDVWCIIPAQWNPSFVERRELGGIFYRPPPSCFSKSSPLASSNPPLPPILSPLSPQQRIRNCPQNSGMGGWGVFSVLKEGVAGWIRYKRRNPGAEMKQEIWHFVLKCQNIFFMASTKVASVQAIIIQWIDASPRKCHNKSQKYIFKRFNSEYSLVDKYLISPELSAGPSLMRNFFICL